MKNTILTFIALLSSAYAFSQADFREGYYISHQNDTIKGLIDFRGNTFNSIQCRFKPKSDSQAKEFTPHEIKAYRFIDGKFYVSKQMTLEKRDTAFFLDCLIKGELTAYFLRTGDDKDYYFVEDSDGTLNTVNNNAIIIDSLGTKYTHRSNQYKGFFHYYFRDHPDLQQVVKTMPYKRNAVIKISKKYHEKACTDGSDCIIYEKKLSKNEVKIGVTALYGNYNSDYGITSGSLFIIRGTTNSIGIGVESQIQLSDLSEKLFFTPRLAYNSMKAEGKTPGYNNYRHYKMSINNVKLNLGAKYLFPKYQVRPILLAGAYTELLKFSNYSARQLSSNIEFPDQLKLKSLFQVGFYIGTGVQFKNLKLNVIYDINTNKGHGKYFYKKGFEYSLCYYFLKLNK
jgi:hypothetical protein